jgi:hypothetical protein
MGCGAAGSAFGVGRGRYDPLGEGELEDVDGRRGTLTLTM